MVLHNVEAYKIVALNLKNDDYENKSTNFWIPIKFKERNKETQKNVDIKIFESLSYIRCLAIGLFVVNPNIFSNISRWI